MVLRRGALRTVGRPVRPPVRGCTRRPFPRAPGRQDNEAGTSATALGIGGREPHPGSYRSYLAEALRASPPPQRPPAFLCQVAVAVTATNSKAAAVIGCAATGARSTLAGSVTRIDLPTPMRGSACCGSPKIRPTTHGVPTSAPRVPRRVAQRSPRVVPPWTIADRSISSGLISVNVVLYRLGEARRGWLSSEEGRPPAV